MRLRLTQCHVQDVETGLQVVQSQESDAAEMSEQIQQLEAEREHLQDVTKDLDLAEKRVRLHARMHVAASKGLNTLIMLLHVLI